MLILRRFFRWLFDLDKNEFDKVVLGKSALRDIINFARNNHPLEFSAFIEGKVRKRVLFLTNVIYQHFEATERSAIIRLDYPTSTNVMGSVHSHPSGGPYPSSTDKRYWGRHGMVNFIIARPYNPRTIRCYDHKGRPLPFSIR